MTHAETLGPYLTADQPGTGGEIKQTPSDFEVEEVPLYRPCGEGEHLYILIEKTGLGTPELVEYAANLFSRSPRQIGFAGLKDKWARTRQTISVPGITDIDALRLNGPNVRVLSAVRHRNKLRVGHLAGNRFRIYIRGVTADAAMRAHAIMNTLARCGVPNYFGKQRFGRGGDNFRRARQWLIQAARRLPRWEQRFRIEAYQSYLFNRCLARRISEGWFDELQRGDIAFKHETGGLFLVEEVERERARAAAFEISPTGPIFGYRMMAPEGEARALEEAVLKAEGIQRDLVERPALKKARVFGGRRPVRVPIHTVDIEVAPDGLILAFELPKGSYATVVLREVMKA